MTYYLQRYLSQRATSIESGNVACCLLDLCVLDRLWDGFIRHERWNKVESTGGEQENVWAYTYYVPDDVGGLQLRIKANIQ